MSKSIVQVCKPFVARLQGNCNAAQQIEPPMARLQDFWMTAQTKSYRNVANVPVFTVKACKMLQKRRKRAKTDRKHCTELQKRCKRASLADERSTQYLQAPTLCLRTPGPLPTNP